MIDKLTKEQEERIPEFIQKWINMASTPMNKENAINAINDIYSRMEEKKPIIIFGDSPLMCSLMAAMFPTSIKIVNGSSQLRSQLYSQLSSQLSSQLHSQLYSQLDSQLDSQLSSQLSSQLKEINNAWYLSIWWLVWCGWYDYSRYIGVKYNRDNYNSFINFNREIQFIIPYKNICFVSEKPTRVDWKNGQLHNDNAAAIIYKDNYGLWALNGVRVTKEIVETKAEDLNPELILREKNAEVRRELVRKIGIGRICEKLQTKTISVLGEMYELIELQIPGMKTPARYLKMRNPSIDVVHLEGVPPDIDTCQEALDFRKPLELQKISIDDENGAEWYQQGDVCIWPEKAKYIKSSPSILT